MALYLSSLNVAWITVWYEGGHSQGHVLFSWRHVALYLQQLSWRLRLVEPATVLEQVVWSITLSVPIFTFLLLLTHLRPFRHSICILATLFAIAGFPIYALCFPFDFPFHLYPPPLADFSSPPLIIVASNRFWLSMEVAATLFGGILYCLRKWKVSLVATVLLLFLHFSLWAWLTHGYVTPRWEIRAYGSWSWAALISTAFYFGFPVLGLLSTLSAGVYLWDSNDSPLAIPDTGKTNADPALRLL